MNRIFLFEFILNGLNYVIYFMGLLNVFIDMFC